MTYIQTLKTGDLAYFDTFSGCIPCKVVKITGESGSAASSQAVVVVLTAGRGAYKRGERHAAWGLHVAPRKSVKGNRIRFYNVQVD